MLTRRNHPARPHKRHSGVDECRDPIDCHHCRKHQRHLFRDLNPLHSDKCLDQSLAGGNSDHHMRHPPFLKLTGSGHTTCWYVELASERALLVDTEWCKIHSRTDRKVRS